MLDACSREGCSQRSIRFVIMGTSHHITAGWPRARRTRRAEAEAQEPPAAGVGHGSRPRQVGTIFEASRPTISGSLGASPAAKSHGMDPSSCMIYTASGQVCFRSPSPHGRAPVRIGAAAASSNWAHGWHACCQRAAGVAGRRRRRAAFDSDGGPRRHSEAGARGWHDLHSRGHGEFWHCGMVVHGKRAPAAAAIPTVGIADRDAKALG